MEESVPVQRDPYRIKPVVLRISRNPALPGRVEHFPSSRKLMRRLDVIGSRKLVIMAMTEDGQETDEQFVIALNHYLRTGFGLRYYRRTAREWQSAAAWHELRSLVGFPAIPLDVQKPTS